MPSMRAMSAPLRVAGEGRQNLGASLGVEVEVIAGAAARPLQPHRVDIVGPLLEGLNVEALLLERRCQPDRDRRLAGGLVRRGQEQTRHGVTPPPRGGSCRARAKAPWRVFRRRRRPPRRPAPSRRSRACPTIAASPYSSSISPRHRAASRVRSIDSSGVCRDSIIGGQRSSSSWPSITVITSHGLLGRRSISPPSPRKTARRG